MSEDITAKGGSTAVGGDVTGTVVNVNSGEGSQIAISFSGISKELGSYLGQVIVFFAEQSLSEYGQRDTVLLAPEVELKAAHNALSLDHQIFVDYRRHLLELERAYAGVEQQNADVRYLVRRKARLAYQQLVKHIPSNQKDGETRLNYVRGKAAEILDKVVEQLMAAYIVSTDPKVREEPASLAVYLIVADAVISCDVLERPNAATA
jgi:hypothetical protein